MNVNENERTNVNEPTNVNENERTNVNDNKVNERELERCRTNVNEPTNMNVKCNYRKDVVGVVPQAGLVELALEGIRPGK
ncbi:Os11g0461066 [Oryza sativa Japonica Group]|uniref:Os11g0461066 protein n=1 Tax=Oryza sativa subsp. japonica TaxID=39947 RepID=A0A0P0Y2J7_ORYSJ|nr:Os11g0461066 [Oryza sativa Japonica Group]